MALDYTFSTRPFKFGNTGTKMALEDYRDSKTLFNMFSKDGEVIYVVVTL